MCKMYESNLASDRKMNAKCFWKYVNSRLKVRPVINAIRREDNSIADSNQEKCELFNKFFTSVFTKENCTTIPTFQFNENPPPHLDDIDITPAIVLDKLLHLNHTKAPGPEGWPILSLKECAQQLCLPLSTLFNKSLESSQLPSSWKVAFITPIHKKGDRSLVSNYRPISLTSPVCKIMESIIKDNIQEYLIDNNIITPYQHGFTPNRSCTSQLLVALNNWTKALDDGYSVDVLYFDFTKAFDSVPHNRLITKLQGCGISGRLLAWLGNFLMGRKQKVVLSNCASEWSCVTSGVPQGSVLGPTLFNVFVCDMPFYVNSALLQFADDVKMFRVIRNPQDFQLLQHDIDNLVDWSRLWQLKFNISKCNVLHLGRPHGFGEYLIDGTTISSNKVVKDLGVFIDDKLKFHDHSSIIAKKANSILAVIHKTFQYMDRNTFVNLYKAYVRPVLEYGNIIWGPQYITDQKSIEKVQRRATKLIHGLYYTSYFDRLVTLNLPSLQYRRFRGDMIIVYQLLHKQLNIDTSDLFTIATTTATRGHNFKLFKHHATTRARSNFLSIRTINHWNNLPDYVVNASSLSSYKKLLDNYYENCMYNYI